MSKEDIHNEIVNLIMAKVWVEKHEVKPEVKLVDLDFDSLDAVEFCFGVEDAFGIEVPDEDLFDGSKFRDCTVSFVVDYVFEKVTKEN